jgi:hypothetical protein
MLIDGGTCRYTPRCMIHTGERHVPVDVRRGARGESYMRVLTIDNVRDIKRQYADGASRYKLAEKFGVCYTTIYDITKGRTWKWVT